MSHMTTGKPYTSEVTLKGTISCGKYILLMYLLVLIYLLACGKIDQGDAPEGKRVSNIGINEVVAGGASSIVALTTLDA